MYYEAHIPTANSLLLLFAFAAWPSSHRRNVARPRLRLIDKSTLLIQLCASFAGVHVSCNSAFIRKIASPFQKHEAGTPALVVWMGHKCVQICPLVWLAFLFDVFPLLGTQIS